jgi:hypothetical protein
LKYVCTQSPKDLLRNGPLVPVTLLAHPRVGATLTEQRTLSTTLLVDTGAQNSFVEQRLAESLSLAPIRYAPVTGVSQQSDLYPVYLMTIRMAVTDHNGTPADPVDFNATVIGLPAVSEHVANRGLLGRDFLRDLRVIYDGPRGLVELHTSEKPPAT